MALLEAHGIGKTFGRLRALEAVDLAIRAGEIHGLIGPNGSGKSTLLKCIAGAERPSEGRICFLDRDITDVRPYARARAGLSIKFQLTSILPALSVFDNALLAVQSRQSIGGLLFSRSRTELAARVMQLLAELRLAGRAGDIAGVLSHGEQQWLEIAMALAIEPKLLLLDEPTAGMSVAERHLTGELLRPLRERCSVVIVEHDLDFIRDICDVLTVLDQGRVLASGTVPEIQANARVQEVYLARV